MKNTVVNSMGFNDRATENNRMFFETKERAIKFLKNSSNMNIETSGTYDNMAWRYDFRPFLKRYIIEYSYGYISKVYALNKTQVRKNAGTKIKIWADITGM